MGVSWWDEPSGKMVVSVRGVTTLTGEGDFSPLFFHDKLVSLSVVREDLSERCSELTNHAARLDILLLLLLSKSEPPVNRTGAARVGRPRHMGPSLSGKVLPRPLCLLLLLLLFAPQNIPGFSLSRRQSGRQTLRAAAALRLQQASSSSQHQTSASKRGWFLRLSNLL